MGRGQDEAIRVLYLDSDSDLTERVKSYLEAEDHSIAVTAETDPQDALEQVATERFDCIISEYELPRMDGLTFFHRAHEIDPELPFVLFTSKDRDEIAAESLEAGVDSYLTKGGGTAQYALLANRIQTVTESPRSTPHSPFSPTEYSHIAAVATDVFWVLELPSESATISDGVAQFGYDPQNLDPDFDWWFERIHPDDRNRLRKQYDALRARDETAFDELADTYGQFSSEYRWRRADDTYADISARGLTLFEDGAPVKMVGTMTDVTERKEREQELREEKAFVESLLDTVPDVVYALDEYGQFLRWNDELCDVTGYTDEEIGEMNALEFIPDDDQARIGEAISRIFEEGAVEVKDSALVTKEGDRIPFEFNGARIEDEEGNILGLAGVGRDISAREEKTRELERQNERLEDFARIVSHDLMNPLTVAKGRLELASQVHQSEHLERASTALDRMETIVEDTLTLARLGQTVAEKNPVSVPTIAERSWTVLETENATLEIADEFEIRADADRLQQVFENLFQNAIEQSDGAVTLRVGALDENGFYIEDDGPGIPVAEREKLFEPGYTTTSEGTGFGLAIVKEIVEAHGWEIEIVESVAGGARFEISEVTTVGT